MGRKKGGRKRMKERRDDFFLRGLNGRRV